MCMSEVYLCVLEDNFQDSILSFHGLQGLKFSHQACMLNFFYLLSCFTYMYTSVYLFVYMHICECACIYKCVHMEARAQP